MGWRGTMRSMNAAAKRASRAAEQSHKAALKAQNTADAAQDIKDWQEYIRELMSIHTSLADKIDWNRIRSAPAPIKPGPISGNERKAKAALSAYAPSAIGKFLGRAKRRAAELAEEVDRGRIKDNSDTVRAVKKFEAHYKEWAVEKGLAERVLAGEADAFVEVVREYQTLSRETQIGKHIGFAASDEGLHVVVDVHDDSIVPTFRRKQLASGKLSQTKMPVGEFNGIYQDYVASVAIRVAGDFFQMLPVDEVYVTCRTEMLDTATGYKTATAILSVQFYRCNLCGQHLTNLICMVLTHRTH